jgi:hypothetical protein
VAGLRQHCLLVPLRVVFACAALAAGVQKADAQQTLPQERGVQQDPTDSRLFRPLIDGDPKNPQRFRRPQYGFSPTFGAGTTGFDSTNARTRRRVQQETQRRKAADVQSAQPVVAPVPDRTVAPIFQPVPSSVARTRAGLRGAGAPEIADLTPRPVRKNYAEEDPFGPVGIRAGSFILRPALDVSTGYDSNPPRTLIATGSAFEKVASELNIRSDWSRHEFIADLRGGYTWYNALSNFNKPDVDLNAKGRIDITKQTNAQLEGRYKLLADSPSDPNLPQGIAKPPLYYQAGATAGLAHRFNRLEISAKGLFDRTAYDQAELNNGTMTSLQDRNYDQYSGLLRAGYELYPGITPFVEGGLDRRIHDLQYDFSGVQRDSNGQVIRAGSTFELARHLTGEASIGYVQREYQDPTLGKLHGMIYDASLIYYATPLTTLKLDAKSRVDESVLPGVSGALIREVGFQVDHSFRRWLIGTLKFGFGQDDYEGSSRIDDRYSASAALIYKITREVHLKGEFRREWLRSNVEGADYTANIAMVGLRLQR